MPLGTFLGSLGAPLRSLWLPVGVTWTTFWLTWVTPLGCKLSFQVITGAHSRPMTPVAEFEPLKAFKFHALLGVIDVDFDTLV